jgi:hypothetical protein
MSQVRIAVLSWGELVQLVLELVKIMSDPSEPSVGLWVDDGIKVKSDDLVWSAPIGKVVLRDR